MYSLARYLKLIELCCNILKLTLVEIRKLARRQNIFCSKQRRVARATHIIMMSLPKLVPIILLLAFLSSLFSSINFTKTYSADTMLSWKHVHCSHFVPVFFCFSHVTSVIGQLIPLVYVCTYYRTDNNIKMLGYYVHYVYVGTYITYLNVFWRTSRKAIGMWSLKVVLVRKA